MMSHLTAAILQNSMPLLVAAEYNMSMMQKQECTSHAVIVANVEQQSAVVA